MMVSSIWNECWEGWSWDCQNMYVWKIVMKWDFWNCVLVQLHAMTKGPMICKYYRNTKVDRIWILFSRNLQSELVKRSNSWFKYKLCQFTNWLTSSVALESLFFYKIWIIKETPCRTMMRLTCVYWISRPICWIAANNTMTCLGKS